MLIYICGFMGAGKTTLWKKLRAENKIDGLDFDAEIARRQSFEPSELGGFIEEVGWDYFRELEINILKETLLKEEGIFSLGGGTATIDKFWQMVAENSKTRVLWLDTDVETCWERVKHDANRPMVKKGKEAFVKLYEERLAYYEKGERIEESFTMVP